MIAVTLLPVSRSATLLALALGLCGCMGTEDLLMLAARDGKLEEVRRLVDAGADVNMLSRDTSLDLIAKHGDRVRTMTMMLPPDHQFAPTKDAGVAWAPAR